MLNGEGEKKEGKGWKKREREDMRRERREGLEKKREREDMRRDGGIKRERNREKKNFALFSCTTYFLTPKYPPAQTCVPTPIPDISTFILNSTCSQDI